MTYNVHKAKSDRVLQTTFWSMSPAVSCCCDWALIRKFGDPIAESAVCFGGSRGVCAVLEDGRLKPVLEAAQLDESHL